eukprot:CAMPEP_0179854370 /NCGR_PEP_ID=MMETSP0982-20121206/9897_1 /TAXON_ID=483367 /ORGANISM="non described non described, Strain CCMP 2436" /LENGTH=151 /DNA_ID=CAMNT_0021740251 /DNA_START=408 /DNA_END=862 /DNA_ORIENTATION=+
MKLTLPTELTPHMLTPPSPCDRDTAGVQMWIMPRTRGIKPTYGSTTTEPEARRNQWAHLVTDNAKGGAPVTIDQDVNIYVSEIDPKTALPFALREGRQLYFVCLEGTVTIGHKDGQAMLDTHEAAEVSGEQNLEVSAQERGAHCLIVEMAA